MSTGGGPVSSRPHDGVPWWGVHRWVSPGVGFLEGVKRIWAPAAVPLEVAPSVFPQSFPGGSP
jgi:hypothetical protein